MWFKIIGSMVLLVGLCITFDARRLVRKNFNFGEENTATLGLKIVGLLLTAIGGIIIISIK